MQILQDKALVIPAVHPKQITSMIPKSKELQGKEVVVHWGIDEVHALRSVGIKAPSPIDRRGSTLLLITKSRLPLS
jgi:hypothetical protein